MSWFAAALVVLLWLPGHALTRLPGVSEAFRKRPSWTERQFAKVAFSIALLLWAAVTLATLGLLFTGSLVAVVAVATALLWRAGKPVKDAFAVDGCTAAVLVIVVAGVLLYRPAFEQIVGGRDPITYIVSGVHTAREGSWATYDDEVTSLPERSRGALLGSDMRATHGHWGPRFLGWYLMDADTGLVVPQGLPLYPSSIAIGYFTAGIDGATNTTVALAVVAALALFFLGRRMFNPAVGFGAALMLLVAPSQVWFSRYANAESVSQLLVLIGLYALLLYRRSGAPALGLFAALAFGASWQAHVLMVWLIPPLAGILVLDLLRGRVGRREALWFWVPLAALGLQALAIFATLASAYTQGLGKVLRWSLWAVVPLLVVAAAALFGVWLWGRREARREAGRSEQERGKKKRKKKEVVVATVGWPRQAVAGALVVGAAYGYLLRPSMVYGWSAESLPRLTLAIGLTAFGLAVAGAAIMLVGTGYDESTLQVGSLALAFAIPILWNPEIRPALMWSLRRFQSFLPLVFLFAAVALFPRTPVLSTRSPRFMVSAMGFVVLAFVAVPLGMQAGTYRGFKQPGEAIALVNDITDGFEEGALIVVEARSGVAGSPRDFAPALAYWKGFEVFTLQNKATDSAVLVDLVRAATRRGQAVYFLTQGFNYFVPEPRFTPHGRWRVERQQLEEMRGTMPENVHGSSLPIAAYRVELGRAEPLDGGLDVGEWDDMYVGEVNPWEYVGELTARWTKGNGFFWLPGLEAGVERITVHAGTVHDSGGLNRTLTATLDGVVLGEIPIEQEWTDYVFDVPSDWQPRGDTAPRLVLTTEPVQPHTVTGNGDLRYLGVLVNAILWE